MVALDKVGSEPSSREEELADVVKISKKMLALARAGEWLEVVTLEERREVLLKNIFTPNIALSLKPDFIRSKIEQVLNYDQQLTLLAKDAQQEIVSAVEYLAKSRQGINQYHQNQELG